MAEERTISLTKGRAISLEKGIKDLKISVEWEENRRSTQVSEDFDIDLMLIEVDSRGLCPEPDVEGCEKADYFVGCFSVLTVDGGKFTDPEHAVIHSGDDRDGSGDGEECRIDLTRVSPKVSEIRLMINIYDAQARRQTFSQIKNAVVKVFADGKDTPKLVYNLGDDYRGDTFLTVGKLVRDERIWKFVALGEGNNRELVDNLQGYGLKFK